MKTKTILLLVLAVTGLNTFAQEVKSGLFIGTYSKENNICSDKVWIREKMTDYTEYTNRSAQFRNEQKDKSYTTGTTFVSDKDCFIVYEFKAHHSGFSCTPITHRVFKGTTLKACEKQMADDVAGNLKLYLTQPKIVFSQCGGNEKLADKGGNSIACDKLPQVLISETGVYYWKQEDGSYVKLTKEQYEKAKNIPDDTKRKRHIQDCTGTNPPRFVAPGWQQK